MKIFSYIKSKLFTVYIIWAILALWISFQAGGELTNDKITHLFIIGIWIVSFFVFKLIKPKNPKRFFIVSSVFLASLGEGTYMISKPVFKDLLVPTNANLSTFLHNWFIDLIFTVPAYVIIFSTIWWLINKYSFSKKEYAFWFALGQALGDGWVFFVSNPFLLILLPYIMLNYHAMNLIPFLKIESTLGSKPRIDSGRKYFMVVLFIVLSYLFAGGLIVFAGRMFGFHS